MSLKDWRKSTKYNSPQYTIISNTLPEYKSFHEAYYISLGRIGKTEDFFISITKKGKQILSIEFKTFAKALAFAKKYMRLH